MLMQLAWLPKIHINFGSDLSKQAYGFLFHVTSFIFYSFLGDNPNIFIFFSPHLGPEPNPTFVRIHLAT
jgi:hypothetical protein